MQRFDDPLVKLLFLHLSYGIQKRTADARPEKRTRLVSTLAH